MAGSFLVFTWVAVPAQGRSAGKAGSARRPRWCCSLHLFLPEPAGHQL